MKRHFIFFALFISILFSLNGQNTPSWVNSFPYSPQYYTGIGSSNRGNRSLDYERALAQARLNLAAEISTVISAETTIKTEDNEEGLRESFSEQLNQTVEQDLREIEIVETWYSEEQGFWVYIRLSKNRWNQIREEESLSLLKRIQKILNETYFYPTVTTAGKIQKLATVSNLLEGSPYGLILSGEIGGVYSGNINDFILTEINRLGTSIEMEAYLPSSETTLAKGLDLEISCHSGENETGRLPLKVENLPKSVLETMTDMSGIAQLHLGDDFLQSGANLLTISIDYQKMGFPDNNIYHRAFAPNTLNHHITVLPPGLFIKIESNKPHPLTTRNSFAALFNGKTDLFEISENQNQSDYTLIFTLTYSEFPRVMDKAPLMAGLQCNMSLRENDRVLYEYETSSFKDGGLTYDQAFERVFRKMMADFNRDAPFIQEIERVLAD